MRSMTGYGKSQIVSANIEITVELKSVNNRYLDIGFKIPSIISSFEPELRDIVRKNVNRGKILVFIDIKEVINDSNGTSIDEKKLMRYYSNLKAIKEKLNIQEPITLNHLISSQELFETDISNIDEDILSDGIKNALHDAIKQFNSMRDKEGRHLLGDIKARIDEISNITNSIHEIAPLNTKVEFERLESRLAELIDTQKIDRDRLEQEIALLAEKVDITEELTRMSSHINQFSQTLRKDSELGKKLTFILQEMHREANTMSSKTTDVKISHMVIQIKEEIEKIREQAQNLE